MKLKDEEVHHPKHYLNKHGIECIDAIHAMSTEEQFIGYCRANAMKYLWRMDYKGKRRQDIEKAIWYLQKLLSLLPK